MKYQVNDTVYLAKDLPLNSNNNNSVIPKGNKGIVRAVSTIGKAYLVYFEKYQKDFLVPESMLQ